MMPAARQWLGGTDQVPALVVTVDAETQAAFVDL